MERCLDRLMIVWGNYGPFLFGGPEEIIFSDEARVVRLRCDRGAWSGLLRIVRCSVDLENGWSCQQVAFRC